MSAHFVSEVLVGWWLGDVIQLRDMEYSILLESIDVWYSDCKTVGPCDYWEKRSGQVVDISVWLCWHEPIDIWL